MEEKREETTLFIKEHLNADVKALALQANRYPNVDMPFAINQIAGRQAITEKIPTWHKIEGLLFPRHLSLEQCSSEATATYKASLVSGDSFADLTGGFGVDCAFMSGCFHKATYIERQQELCEIALHNFTTLGLHHIKVVNANGEEYLNQIEKVDCLFLDPARRNEHGGKTVAISDCEPDVKSLSKQLLEKATTVMIKLSPMLDITQALNDLPQTEEVHIVSVANECKEILFILKSELLSEKKITCVNIRKNGEADKFTFTREKESKTTCEITAIPESYLYEPNSSILKAGAYKSIAQQFGIKKLHPNSHLYTSTELIKEFPGRTFGIVSCFSFNKKEIKTKLAGITKANITVRNFPATVDELRKRLKLKEGGEDYLFATTTGEDTRMMIHCKALPPTSLTEGEASPQPSPKERG